MQKPSRRSHRDETACFTGYEYILTIGLARFDTNKSKIIWTGGIPFQVFLMTFAILFVCSAYFVSKYECKSHSLAGMNRWKWSWIKIQSSKGITCEYLIDLIWFSVRLLDRIGQIEKDYNSSAAHHTNVSLLNLDCELA